MNEFLQQFVIESRELVSQAVEGVLHLERSPQDANCLDSVFRAFHTLKGGAGIVEFAAMEHAVHAAEDLLGKVRAGRSGFTAELVRNCLAALDQVSRWLETIAQTGALPADADQQSYAMIRRFGSTGEMKPSVTAESDSAQWLAHLTSRHFGEQPSTAVRFQPSVDCFLLGEDPVERIATLPQLLRYELLPVAPWPSLSELDPYSCNLLLMALTGSPIDSVHAHLQGHSGRCDIVAVVPARVGTVEKTDFAARAAQVLRAQIALLAVERQEQFSGRLLSAGSVAANALRALRRDADSRIVSDATTDSLAQGSVQPLLRTLQELLSPAQMAVTGGAERSQSTTTAPATVRVGTDRIDALVRLTGELTTAKNSLRHLTERAHAEGLELATPMRERLGEFERLIGQLQRSVLTLRVLPLGTVLQRFPRVLREASSALGKPVALQISGDHTEADKAIVEMLFEPLLHILRNAIDHGIETPTVRVERGKPLVASIKIRAARQGDRVLIEVEDDGAGVNLERVRRVALDRGIATQEALQAMPEEEVIDLIFAPGFSTASAVTALSGRGVGLDAVRNAIDRVGGMVSIESRWGQGTTARFSLPFSVMVTQVLTVEAGEQTFGIPLDALLETVKVPSASISGVGAAQVVVHRQRSIPLLDLAGELGRGGDCGAEYSDLTVVLASVAGEVVALRVDRVGERMDVILKPLDGLLMGLWGIAGTTLLGDGRVLLILDLREMLT